MYAMRQCIRQEKGVTAGYEAAKMELRCQDDHELGCCLLDDDVFAPNQNLGALLDDALLARDLNHAMSVIAYSVRSGRKEWFHDCLHRTKQKVRCGYLWSSPNPSQRCHAIKTNPWHAKDGTSSLDAEIGQLLRQHECVLTKT